MKVMRGDKSLRRFQIRQQLLRLLCRRRCHGASGDHAWDCVKVTSLMLKTIFIRSSTDVSDRGEATAGNAQARPRFQRLAKWGKPDKAGPGQILGQDQQK